MSYIKNFTLTQPAAIVIAGVVIAGAIIYSNVLASSRDGNLENQDQALPDNVSIVAPSADDHIVGSPNAEIVLVEYLDFECPYCQIIEESFEKIVNESNGSVAWVMRNLPLKQIHAEAEPAAHASECVAEQKGSEGYRQFVKTALAHQQQLGKDFYEQTASALGVDMTQYRTCISSQKYKSKIDAQAADAMKNGAQGTPFTVVYGNGKQVPIPGALPYEQLKSIISTVRESR